jgi:hypothetical protein
VPFARLQRPLFRPEGDFTTQLNLISAQRIRQVSPQGFRILFGSIDEALALGFRFVRGFAEKGAALLIECFVLIFIIGTLLFSLGLLGIRIRKFSGDSLLSRIDGIENRLVEKMLQQPHQDEEVDNLRSDSELVDEHRSLPSGLR